jgi:hypothetical protein
MATRKVKSAAKQIAKRSGLLPKRSQRSEKTLSGVQAPKDQIHYEVAKLPPGSLVLYKGKPMLLLSHCQFYCDRAELLFPDGSRDVKYKWLSIPPESCGT